MCVLCIYGKNKFCLNCTHFFYKQYSLPQIIANIADQMYWSRQKNSGKYELSKYLEKIWMTLISILSAVSHYVYLQNHIWMYRLIIETTYSTSII